MIDAIVMGLGILVLLCAGVYAVWKVLKHRHMKKVVKDWADESQQRRQHIPRKQSASRLSQGSASGTDYNSIRNGLTAAIDELTELPASIKQDSPNSPDALAWFSLFNTLLSTLEVLVAFPKTIRVAGQVCLELRLYYDCLWQLVLLSRFSSGKHQEKTSYLFASVKLKVDDSLVLLGRESPELNPVVFAAHSRQYADMLKDAVRRYIHGATTGVGDALIPFVARMTEVIQKQVENLDTEALALVLANATGDALTIELLTEFDLDACDVLKLPPHFYE